MNGIRTAVALLGAAAIILPAAAGAAQSPPHLPNHATITLSQARAKAVTAVPGTIRTAELQHGPGGSLIYSFDINAASGGRRDVDVDAKTGKVVENRAEPARAEQKEKGGQLTTQPPY